MNPYADRTEGPLEPCDGFEGKVFHTRNQDLFYRIRLPENLNDGSAHPLLLVMHGAGSIGNENRLQLFLANLVAGNEFVKGQAPIVVAPQCPKGQRWVKVDNWNAGEYTMPDEPGCAMQAVLKLIDFILSEYPVDFSRLYVTGASMGGFACWELMRRRPGLFAAAIPVCSGADFNRVLPNPSTAVRLFHGIEDATVPVNNSRRLYLMLMDANCDVKLKEYPGVGHDAWTPAYSDPETMHWLFAQKQNYFTSVPVMPDYKVITLNGFGFSAKIMPDAGGNLFSMRHNATGCPLLREPHRPEELFHAPERFGIPLLFPPNRIEDGCFMFEGRICRLPVTETRNNNHLHGLAVNKIWEVVSADNTRAVLRYSFGENDPEYQGFPFAFELIRTYELTAKGLTDTLKVVNNSEDCMPLGAGYHTAFPAEDASVKMGVGNAMIEIGKRILPTGRLLAWNEINPTQEFNPFGHNIGFHTTESNMTGFDGTEFHGAEIRFREGILRYITDDKFGFWYTWNNGGLTDFLCLEPTSWMANAPNLPIPSSISGVRTLGPKDSAVFVNKLEFYPVE